MSIDRTISDETKARNVRSLLADYSRRCHLTPTEQQWLEEFADMLEERQAMREFMVAIAPMLETEDEVE